MFFGFGKAGRKRPTSEPYEWEAALLLGRRIAEGRPPPDVWRKAEEGRARRAQPAGWYVPAAPEPCAAPEAGRRVPFDGDRRLPAPITQPFVLRLVRLPSAGARASRPTTGSW